MGRVPLYTGPPSTPARFYEYAGGVDKNYSPQHFAGTAYANCLRNGSFESWSQGASVRPDAWETSGGGTIAKTSSPYWGNQCAKITKLTSDIYVSRLYQTVLNEFYPTPAAGHIFTFSAMVKTTGGAESTWLYFYDGSNNYNSDYHSGGSDWEELRFTFQYPSSGTDFRVGLACAIPTGSSKDYYIDCAQLVCGPVTVPFMEHPNDRSVICQDFDDDGTKIKVRGGMRLLPYEISGSFTGGATSEVVPYTLHFGCRQLVVATVNVYYLQTLAYNLAIARTDNYSTTGFDINFYANASIPVGEDYTFTGIIMMMGWDDPTEQWT